MTNRNKNYSAKFAVPKRLPKYGDGGDVGDIAVDTVNDTLEGLQSGGLFGGIGGLLNGVIDGLTGTAAKEKKAAEQAAWSKRQAVANKADRIAISQFPSIGTYGIGLYGAGGVIPAYGKGGITAPSDTYIAKLKTMENAPGNLQYHKDSMGYPTIGWGHRLTSEEKTKGAVRIGKEWIPFSQFQGNRGAALADRLLQEVDLVEHQNRLHKQLENIAIDDQNAYDALLDITYNQGSLKPGTLKLLQKGDYNGLAELFNSVATGDSLEEGSGLNDRWGWRAQQMHKAAYPLSGPRMAANVRRMLSSEQPSNAGQTVYRTPEYTDPANQMTYQQPVMASDETEQVPDGGNDIVPRLMAILSHKGAGGQITPNQADYQAEDGEVIQYPAFQIPKTDRHGSLRALASDTATIQGDTHNAPSGGVGMTASPTGAQRIFSDRLPVNPAILKRLKLI